MLLNRSALWFIIYTDLLYYLNFSTYPLCDPISYLIWSYLIWSDVAESISQTPARVRQSSFQGKSGLMNPSSDQLHLALADVGREWHGCPTHTFYIWYIYTSLLYYACMWYIYITKIYTYIYHKIYTYISQNIYIYIYIYIRDKHAKHACINCEMSIICLRYCQSLAFHGAFEQERFWWTSLWAQ